MDFSIGNYLFTGPFTSIDQIENKSGIFMVFCGNIKGFIIVDISEANNIKTAIEDNMKKQKWEKFCYGGELLFGCYYLEEKSKGEREIINNKIRKKYRPLLF